MECEFRAFDTPRRQTAEHALSEVQTGCRRGDRPTLASINRLITIAIGQAILAPDVRRQRHVADPIDRLDDVDASVGPQAYRPAALKVSGEDLAVQPCAEAFEHDPGPRLQLLAGMHQCFPPHRHPSATLLNSRLLNTQLPASRHPPGCLVANGGCHVGRPESWSRELANQQAFNSPAAWKAMPQQARRKHFRIVQNQKIAVAQVLGKVREDRVLDLPAVSMQHQQARIAPLGGRLLRNQLIGKVEVEVAGHHDLARDPRPSP